MKKLFILTLVFAVAAVANVAAFAQASTGITTGLTQDLSGGNAPVVKVKWEAYGAANKGTGTPYGVTDYYMDEEETDDAQFLPSGQYGVNTTIAICAIVADPGDGLADITEGKGGVYADVFYPEHIALGDSHEALPDQTGAGCGGFMQEDELTKLDKMAGMELFCNNVRNQNNNLPTFNPNGLYDYNEICNEDGELMKETAAVYCTTKDLSYEDPNGDYRVMVVAQDDDGLDGRLENTFTYESLTAYEADFGSVSYGNVKLGTEKTVSGNLTWGDDIATIRNVGNTRMAIEVWQDDMDFGKTDGIYNVSYKARVGSFAPWTSYIPYQENVVLMDDFDLSEKDEIDFGITVHKFPPIHEGECYTGGMTLTAIPVAHIYCVN